MTLATKLKSNPRITDRQLIDLILKSSKLTKAFGAKSLATWNLAEKKSTHDSLVVSPKAVLNLE